RAARENGVAEVRNPRLAEKKLDAATGEGGGVKVAGPIGEIKRRVLEVETPAPAQTTVSPADLEDRGAWRARLEEGLHERAEGVATVDRRRRGEGSARRDRSLHHQLLHVDLGTPRRRVSLAEREQLDGVQSVGRVGYNRNAHHP